MAGLTLSEKATRVFKMLLGIRIPTVADAMAAYGFNDAELDEGWRLLRTVTERRIDPYAQGRDTTLVSRVDAWENRWFPIARATLEHRYAEVAKRFFRNLPQSSGPAVLVGVSTFITRFDQMAAGAGGFGKDGIAAAKRLEARGLTAPVIEEARTLLARVPKLPKAPNVRTLEHDKAEQAKAVDALWAWYLEWSRIARVAVTQPSLLAQMGFKHSMRNEDDPVTFAGAAATAAASSETAERPRKKRATRLRASS